MPKVSLVGAGPGAVDLLTVRAARIIATADVLLADALVAEEVLALGRPGVRILRVGKRGGMRSTPQDFIHRAMARYARLGLKVVRVKGGDPFVFGRGGEEQAYLEALGMEVEVVPGLTAGLTAAAAAGIPVTHRAYTHGVTLVTGTAGDGCGEPDWAALAKGGTTLVIYMGLNRVLNISARLIAGGLTPDTPAAAIASGTLPGQRHIRTTLAELPVRVQAGGLASPAIIVVGAVAALALPETRALAEAQPELGAALRVLAA